MRVLQDTGLACSRVKYITAQSLRTAWYSAHFAVIRRRGRSRKRDDAPELKSVGEAPDMAVLRQAFLALFRRDLANVEAGLYPPPDDFRLRDLPRALKSSRLFMQDVSSVERRRQGKEGLEVRQSPAADPKRYPAYYRQNFHYQTDGWLSDTSARVYDTQVEVLFTGAADAMRRAVLAELSRELAGRDQRKITYLDLACGTGRFLRQTLQVFPKLQASGMDLSPNYCAAARRLLRAWPQAGIIEGAGEAMPLADASQAIISSIYLFHELPPGIRLQVISEVARAIQPGGLFILADSLQYGDTDGLDGLLEYFPHAFHEPYYKSYLSYDFDEALERAGFVRERRQLAFMTKVTTWRRL